MSTTLKKSKAPPAGTIFRRWRKSSSQSHPDRKLRILEPVLREIERTIGSMPAEQGGALGGDRETGIVTHFHFDHSARQTGASYSPDHEFLNRLFKDEWNPAGINLLGFVHSHPPSFRRPSGGDIFYSQRILEYIPELERLFLPIIVTRPDTGSFEIFPYAVVRDGKEVRIDPLELIVMEPGLDRSTSPTDVLDSTTPQDAPANIGETFRRVETAYDLRHLESCRVIYVGVGGAAGFVEDMARSGVGEHVLLDHDHVTETNLATQQVYRRDIGRPKVACLAERVADINPNCVAVPCQARLEDLQDSDLAKLVYKPFRGNPPSQTLICGLTDNFETQARVNRLALQFGLPSLCAQVYPAGRGAEITFTLPGVTPACHRCALRSRYEAYLREGFSNNVTSDGTPIFATTRLNALKGFIAMALLHHGARHPRWGRLLERIGNRNLIQIRMDPDLQLPIFDKVFGNADRERIVFDDVVWLPQKADCPENGFPRCPDCRGTGNLLDAKGTFNDTRDMRV
jgi:proteasome lid subunit RPN8/RPN11